MTVEEGLGVGVGVGVGAGQSGSAGNPNAGSHTPFATGSCAGAAVVGCAEEVFFVGLGFGGGGVYGAWPGDGAVPSRFAGGGKSWTGRPCMIELIAAAHVAVG